jgi:hypothetical protein
MDDFFSFIMFKSGVLLQGKGYSLKVEQMLSMHEACDLILEPNKLINKKHYCESTNGDYCYSLYYRVS